LASRGCFCSRVRSSFVAQSQVAESASRPDERAVDSGLAGAFALWLIVLGLALVGVAVLVADARLKPSRSG
jgi:hypothetical protein